VDQEHRKKGDEPKSVNLSAMFQHLHD
jgi:hypothetical protein